MDKKLWKQMLSTAVAVSMLCTSLSWDGLRVNAQKEVHDNSKSVTIPFDADNMEVSTEISILPEEVTAENEITEERTAYSTVYDLGGNKKMEVLYGSEIRFEDENGDLVDYDPSLVKVKEDTSLNGESLEGYTYRNAQGDKKHYLPEELTETTPILMEKEGYSISFFPVEVMGTEETSGIEHADIEEPNTLEPQEGNLPEEEGFSEAVLEEEEVTNLYGEEETLSMKAVYDNKESGKTLVYESSDIGIKENLVLESVPEGNSFTHEFHVKGMTIRKNPTDEGLRFMTRTQKK